MSATVHSLHPIDTPEALPADYTQGWNDGRDHGVRYSALRHRTEGAFLAIGLLFTVAIITLFANWLGRLA